MKARVIKTTLLVTTAFLVTTITTNIVKLMKNKSGIYTQTKQITLLLQAQSLTSTTKELQRLAIYQELTTSSMNVLIKQSLSKPMKANTPMEKLLMELGQKTVKQTHMDSHYLLNGKTKFTQ